MLSPIFEDAFRWSSSSPPAVPRRISAERQALRSADGTPEAARACVLEALRRAAGAGGAALLRCDGSGSAPAWVDVVASPSAVAPELIAALQREGEEPASAWHPRNPPRRAVDRFVLTSAASVPGGSPLAALAAGPVAAAMTYDGPRLLGQLVLWATPAGALRRRELDALNALLGEAVRSLARAARREEEELAAPTSLVVRDDGRVLFASASAATWLAADARLAKVRQALAQVAARAALEATRVVDGALATFLRLEGQGHAWLVTLVAPTPPTLTPDAALSERQRAVAHSAAVGATAAEIARELGISEQTVRDHLKAVYRRLGVASRLELSQRLGH